MELSLYLQLGPWRLGVVVSTAPLLSARLPVRTLMRAGFSKGHAVRGMIGSKCGFAHVAGLRNDT